LLVSHAGQHVAVLHRLKRVLQCTERYLLRSNYPMTMDNEMRLRIA